MPTEVGLGLRFEFLEDVLARIRAGESLGIDVLEVAPENFMRRGGYLPSSLEEIAAAVPVLSHGLTMDFGGTDALDSAYLEELRSFTKKHRFPFHSDHLCFSAGGGRVFHDLLPLPLFRETVTNAVERIREVRDRLGLPVAIE